jgi:hypothetical protein
MSGQKLETKKQIIINSPKKVSDVTGGVFMATRVSDVHCQRKLLDNCGCHPFPTTESFKTYVFYENSLPLKEAKQIDIQTKKCPFIIAVADGAHGGVNYYCTNPKVVS